MKSPIAAACSAALLSLVLGPFAPAAHAQQPTQAQANAIKQSCRADYQSVCASVPPGGRAALQCLQQNVASLSPACQSAVSAASGGSAPPSAASRGTAPPQAMAPSSPPPAMSRRQEMMLMRNACGGDFRAYCSGVELGGGRAIGCLAANESRLSPSCRSALAQAHAGR